MRLVERLAGGDICVAHRAVTDAGREVFVTSLASVPAGFFAAEAAELAWLARRRRRTRARGDRGRRPPAGARLAAARVARPALRSAG